MKADIDLYGTEQPQERIIPALCHKGRAIAEIDNLSTDSRYAQSEGAPFYNRDVADTVLSAANFAEQVTAATVHCRQARFWCPRRPSIRCAGQAR